MSRLVNFRSYNEDHYDMVRFERATPFTLASLTVPDMHISLREMLNRHNSGGRVKQFTPVYLEEGSPVPVGLESMSKIDRAEYANQLADFVKTSRGKLISQRQAREKAHFDSIVEAAALTKVSALSKSPTVDSGDSKPGKA